MKLLIALVGVVTLSAVAIGVHAQTPSRSLTRSSSI